MSSYCNARRPHTLVAALVLALWVLLGACDAGGTDRDAAVDTDAESPAPQPQEEQVLTVGYEEDTYSFGEGARPDLGKWPLNPQIFDTLVHMTEELEIEPMLAETWEYDRNTNTHRFELREDVVFHDGSAFTADDVKYTVDTIAAANPTNYQQLGPDSTVVVDPHTVEITTTEPNERLVDQLTHASFGINRAGSDPLEPIGTGPFRFVEYTENDRLVVERFDDYWGETAKADRITFRFIEDQQTRLLGLRSGELDLVYDVPVDAVQEIEASPDLALARSGPAAFGRIDMNIAGQEPFDILEDPQVREAVAHAVDRSALVETVYGDNADDNPLPGHLFGEHADEVEGVPFDPDRAAELLEEAGWARNSTEIREKDGRQLSLTYLTLSPTPDARLIGEVLQDQLSAVGVSVEIDPSTDSGITSERRENGQYDLLHQGGSQNNTDPCFLLDLLYYSPERGGREGNRFLAPGGAVDDAIEDCRSAPSTDEAQMHAAEAARLLIEELHIYVPTGNAYRLWASRANVQDFVPHPALGRGNFKDIYLAAES